MHLVLRLFLELYFSDISIGYFIRSQNRELVCVFYCIFSGSSAPQAIEINPKSFSGLGFWELIGFLWNVIWRRE